MTYKAFDNPERTRYYGLRPGDIVSMKGLNSKEVTEGEVIELSPGDNNRVHVKTEAGHITDWVAEWCDIITKVEDRATVDDVVEVMAAFIEVLETLEEHWTSMAKAKDSNAIMGINRARESAHAVAYRVCAKELREVVSKVKPKP